MSDPTFLGLDKSRWDLINSFANWFAAFASFAAAAVALYLANRAAKPTARSRVGHRIIVEAGSIEPYPEYVLFKIVNTGDRPIRISQIGWRCGLIRKRYAVQMCDEALSSRLPIDLTHGQEAQWMVPLFLRDEYWPDYFVKGFLNENPRISLLTLRAEFHSSVGVTFRARPEKRLREKLASAIKKSNGQWS